MSATETLGRTGQRGGSSVSPYLSETWGFEAALRAKSGWSPSQRSPKSCASVGEPVREFEIIVASGPTDGMLSVPVIAHAHRALARVVQSAMGVDGIDEWTAEQVLQFLSEVGDARTTFPSILPDEDRTATLHWLATPMSLVIQIDRSGPIYGRAQHGDRSVEWSDNSSEIIELARRSLREITDHVEAVNPRWRDTYRS